MCTLHCTL
jgi:hypothetical protein